jgi:MFS family permease
MQENSMTKSSNVTSIAAMNSTTRQSQRLLSNRLILFMVAMILANIGGHMYEPLLPLYLKDLNASVAQIGLFFTVAQIIPLTMQILGGWISDSLGRLRSVAFGSLAGMLAHVGLILAPTWQWVLLGEGLGAVTRSLIGPSFMAFIAQESSGKSRARVYGITEAMFMIVAVVGPPLGGWLAQNYGFKFMLLWAAGLYLIATVIRVIMARSASRTDEANPEKLTFASLKLSLSTMLGLLLSGGILIWILLTDGIRDIAYMLSFNLMPVYLDEIGGMSLQQIGWLHSFFGVLMMLITIPAGWLADKKGERIAIALGFVIQCAAFIVFVRVNGFIGFSISSALLGLGIGLMSPAYESLISKVVPERLRGTAFGLFSTSLGVVSLPAPAVGAQLYTRLNPQLPFRLTALLSLIAVIPVWKRFKYNGIPDPDGPQNISANNNSGD